MKFAITLVLVLSAATTSQAQSQTEKALRTLQTSLDREERISALGLLREQKTLPESAGIEMGRLIFSHHQPEAHIAAEVLPILGEASLPILVKLMQDRVLDTQILASYSARRLNRSCEAAFLKATRLLLQRQFPAERFPAVLAIGTFNLSTTEAKSLTREILKDRSYGIQFVAAISIAGHSFNELDDTPAADLFQEMQTSHYATVRYAGARLEEQERQFRWRGGKRAPPRLTPEETARRQLAEQRLRQLAGEALKECLDLCRPADDPYVKLAVFRSLQFMYPHVVAERAAIARFLKDLPVERGAILDKEILQWRVDYLERAP